MGILIPKQLVDQIAAGNCIAFVGSGLSTNSGLPVWPVLLTDLVSAAVEEGIITNPVELFEAIQAGDLLSVAEEIRDRLGQDRFRAAIVNIFRASKPRPVAVHDALLRIRFRAIVTTNYDNLIETAYSRLYGEIPPTFTHADYPELSAYLRSGAPYVLKAHGTIDRSATIILGRSDYRQIMHENVPYRKHLESLFLSRTVLFLGFGVTDPDLLLLMDELISAFGAPGGNLYAMMSDRSATSFRRRRLERDYGIQLLTYAASGDSHPEVTRFLDELRRAAGELQVGDHAVEAGDPVDGFATDVRSWLEAMRYVVDQPERLTERVVSLKAVLQQGIVRQHILVHCIGAEVKTTDVVALQRLLDIKTPEGWIIADRRISSDAADVVRPPIRMFTFAEFLEKVVWANYITELRAEAERIRLNELYVEPNTYRITLDDLGRRETERERLGALEDYIDTWLPERGKSHISVLGDFGSGKSWFARHLAIKQLQRFLKDPTRERLPILVTLRTFAKAMSVQQLLNEVFYEQFKLPFLGSAFDIFQQMNRRGKILLILDGFDEMARQVDYQTVVDNFWELAKLVDNNSKVILTSRTEYFRWAQESERVLSGQEYGRNHIILEPPRFEVIYIEPFSDYQIRDVIKRRLGAQKGEMAATYLLGQPELAEMLRKPVLIELLLAATDEVSTDRLISMASVYLHATNRLLVRNIASQKTFTSTGDKLYFLCELAWEMLREQNLRIHFSQIPGRIQTYFGNKIRNPHELDSWDFDLRTQTLLHRDAGGFYEFAHKSLAEYFVALKFGCELNCVAPEFRETYLEHDQSLAQMPQGPRTIEALSISFGAIPWASDQRMFAVSDMLGKMVDDRGARQLWDLIGKCRGVEAGYVVSNVATLLCQSGSSFVGSDLTGLNLDSALLPRDLRFVAFSGSVLSSVDLRGLDLRCADFTDVLLESGQLAGSDIRGAKGNIIHAIVNEPVSPKIWDEEVAQRLLAFLCSPRAVCCFVGPGGSGKSSCLSHVYHSSKMKSEGESGLRSFGAWSIIWNEGEFTRMFTANRTRHQRPLGIVAMATTLSRFGYDELISALEDMRATFVRTGNWIDVPEKDFIALVHYTKRAVESEPFVLCFDDFSPFVMSGLAQFFGSFPHKAKVIISSTKMPAQVDENAMVVETVYRPGQVSPPPASVAHPKNVRSLLGSGAN